TAAYSGPCRSSADAVITTSAPASRYLISSVEPSTPVVAASDAPIRPCSNVIHVSGSRASAARDNDVPGATASVSGSMSGCDQLKASQIFGQLGTLAIQPDRICTVR